MTRRRNQRVDGSVGRYYAAFLILCGGFGVLALLAVAWAVFALWRFAAMAGVATSAATGRTKTRAAIRRLKLVDTGVAPTLGVAGMVNGLGEDLPVGYWSHCATARRIRAS